MDIKHKTPIELRKWAGQYIRELPFAYDCASVLLPRGRSAPQPIIPIVDKFVYKDCPFKSVNQSVIRQHGNKVNELARETLDSGRLLLKNTLYVALITKA